ncbi:AlpA family transcriptional regulator [Acinetobacter sp. NRRL B-65365]|uniref:helix-turn-helix transcriptional regulator n=1 Tax=Acinetobacter sp. NRRL B-65365 TaxID=1785092 RepID=UPI0007A0054D|nr:AlpA family phage regulatory protein [Acinetobacter sp. NRRL B-65365]KYQ81964.1 AlpA family transcriptional regulator [Acinetobacter sp. NRRL B-65365]
MNAFVGHTFQMNQILNLKDIMLITRLGRATIYNMLDPKNVSYDPTFPKQIKLSSIFGHIKIFIFFSDFL